MNEFTEETLLASNLIKDQWMNPNFQRGLVSVIIPTFNRCSLLEEALTSIEKQTYRPVEVIIIDDGSSDSTQSTVDKWIRRKSCQNFKILYFYQHRLGAQIARNCGLIKSSGEFIQFLDSDDALVPQKLEWSLEVLKNSESDFVYFRTQVTDHNLEPIPNKIYGISPTNSPADDIVAYLWHTSGPVYRRNVLIQTGSWLESLSGSQDWEYGARIKLLGYKGYFDPRIGSLFRNHENERIGVSKINYKYTKSAELAYDNIYNIAKQYNLLDEKLSGRLARLYLTRALEFNELNFSFDCHRCLKKAKSLQSSKNLVWLIIIICSTLPNTYTFKIIHRLLVVRRNW